MIARLIRWSIGNRFLVLLATLMLTGWGLWAMSRTPLDAIPDLSDVQVIIRTTYPGQAPQIVESQVTYQGRRRSAASRRSATRSSTSCSTTAPISTGRVRACSNT